MPHPPAHHVPLLPTSLPPPEQDRLHLQFLQHWHRAGLLILLSLTLFVVNCNRLRPRPQVSYQLAFYLCWCASVLMLWAGTLSFLNQVRMWNYTTPFMERRLSYFRWASRHHSLQLQLQHLEPAQKLSAASSFVNYHGAPQQRDAATSQDTDESPRPDASTSVPVTQFPSDLP
uniref:uncharacterized protein LOC117721715 isoform X1 n=1 Tax=Arvicanthis niloticus TaxID=61156 RepID=UPI0014871BFD|nr:uncharacterized protein LOC117721715 isoform X1 [Arvicanthis niloticus]